MKVDKKAALFIFFLSLGLVLWAGEGQSQKKETAKGEEKSLIKKELLSKTKKKLAPARRNIFSLSRGVSEETRIVQNDPRTNPQKAARTTEKESSRSPVNIRYIGHIRSGQKIVALIVYEDTAIAVEKGEMINEGVQIGDVTPAYIEIIGPDSVRRKYTLEGEKE
jgi:Tfp pilus assembly protein PilP